MLSEIKTEQPFMKNVRIKFSKTGAAQYISHLDLARTMTRALLRARIPIWFSEGFNPRPKLVFATPLSVGAESVSEYLDIRIISEMSLSEIKERLAAALPPDIAVQKVYEPIVKFAEIAFSRYEITVQSDEIKNDFTEKAKSHFAQALTAIKKGKSGEREIVLNDYIKEISFTADGESLVADALLTAGTADFLNPEFVATEMKKLLADSDKCEWRILRREIYKADMTVFE